MNLAICIKSCQYDKSIGCHQAIRDTWGNWLPEEVDLYFFMGGEQPKQLEFDEEWLPVDDGYWPSMQKTKAISNFIVDCEYDYGYLCDTDTYLKVDDMLNWPFRDYDYSGGHLCSRRKEDQLLGHPYNAWHNGHDLIDPFYNYFSGGVGFFLSNKASRIVSESEYYVNSEDVCVGRILGPEIGNNTIKAGILQGIEGTSVWHLNCGFYGGGHKERLNAGEAVRRHHADIGNR